MRLTKERVEQAIRHLRRSDKVMRSVIDAAGPFALRPQRDRFGMLVRSIISQQISVSAAQAIRARLLQRLAPERLTPHSVLGLEIDELRSVGLSRRKASYVLDLAHRCADQRVRLNVMGRRTDDEVIDELTQVNGIGRWTAQMFLIFALGRPDVFPDDDLGVRAAIRDRYGLSEMPDRNTSCRIASAWRPYASVGSWYCWRILEVGR